MAASQASLAWLPAARLSAVTSNPNWEQFGGRSIPFGGDYFYISAAGGFSYGTCRTVLPGGSISGDTCPWQGGPGQNIYGNQTP